VGLAEQQLTELRDRLKQIRNAKKWLQEYRINAPSSISSALAAYYNWLDSQENKTIAMGKKIKAESEKK
jgi:hypothetical protein